MESLNDDCILYMVQFLTFNDKISLIQTCKRIYNLAVCMFKTESVLYDNEGRNLHWIKKYNPEIEVYTTLDDLKNTSNNIPRVYKLSICGQDLTKLDTSLIDNIQFKELDLDCNKLDFIPTLFTSSTMLTRLDMMANNISIIPESIKYLSNLKILSLPHNHIKKFPKEMVELKNLEILIMYKNKIRDIRHICGLKNLKNICLSRNKIDSIPDEINLASNLEELDLSFNNIKCVSGCIGQLTKLKRLNLWVNCIKTLPDSFPSSLNSLNISCNKLKILPHSMKNLKLDYLDVSDNQLTSLDIVEHMTTLRRLEVTQNRYLCLPLSMMQLTFLSISCYTKPPITNENCSIRIRQ